LAPEAAPLEASLLEQVALPLLRHLAAALAADPGRRPPVIALNGPVGAGKTSLGRALEGLAPRMGLRLAVASIDDLYLPWSRRREVLAGNPFGVARVPPGSHDVPLLLEQLDLWRAGSPLRLPRFDKTLAEGQGDRSGWRQLEVDALILEGWLMGCRALGATELASGLARIGAPAATGSPQGGAPALTPVERDWLPRWDRELEAYAPLWQACDGLWVLRPARWELPLRWRLQAEARQRRGGGGWLAAREVERLVRASLCSLPPQLYQDPLVAGWPGEEGLRLLGAVELDGRRRCRAAPTQFSPSSASSEIG
jgi:D-glycerate 3-kinase